jgi:hypothetical protein
MRPTWLLLGLFALGCASGPAGPKASTASSPTATATEAESTGQSAPKSRVWGLFDPEAARFGYVDVQSFLDSPVGRSLLATFQGQDGTRAPDPAGPIEEFNQRCGFDLTKAVRELTFGAKSADEELTFVFALDITPDQALACLREIDRFEPFPLAGRTAWCEWGYSYFPSEDNPRPLSNRQCLVPHGSLLVMSSFSRLETLLAHFPAASGAPPVGEHLRIAAEFPNPLGVERVTLALAGADPKRARLRLEAKTGSPEHAANLEAQARDFFDKPSANDVGAEQIRELLRPYLEKAELGHHHKTAHATLTLEDGALGGPFFFSSANFVKQHLTDKRARLARNAVFEIAWRLVGYNEGLPKPHFPPSAPRVPSQVPSGARTLRRAPIGRTRAGRPSRSTGKGHNTTLTSTRPRRTASAPPFVRSVTSTVTASCRSSRWTSPSWGA